MLKPPEGGRRQPHADHQQVEPKLVVVYRVRLLWPHGLQPARLLCPWDSPSKNTGVGCHFLLQGIFLTQGLNLGLPHCRQMLYCLSHQGRSDFKLERGGSWNYLGGETCHYFSSFSQVKGSSISRELEMVNQILWSPRSCVFFLETSLKRKEGAGKEKRNNNGQWVKLKGNTFLKVQYLLLS